MALDQPRIFFEKQEGNLCAQHCLNALLQSQTFSVLDLADTARRLDEDERLTLTNSAAGGAAQSHESQNMDDSGFFSVQVIAVALREVCQLELVSWNKPDVRHLRDDPCQANAFICNHREHWFTFKRFGTDWFNLNSMLTGPMHVSNTHLSITLAQLQSEQYSIFCVLGELPACALDGCTIDRSLYVNNNAPINNRPNTRSTRARTRQRTDEDDVATAIALSLGQEHDLDDAALQAVLRASAADMPHTQTHEDADEDLLQQALAASLQQEHKPDASVSAVSTPSTTTGTASAATGPSSAAASVPTATAAVQMPSADEVRDRRALFLQRLEQQKDT